MPDVASLCSWFIRAAVVDSLVLILGFLALARVRQPVERLRLIQWVLAACLAAPWLPVMTDWRTVSVDLNLWARSGPAAVNVATASNHLPPASTSDEPPRRPPTSGSVVAPAEAPARPVVSEPSPHGAVDTVVFSGRQPETPTEATSSRWLSMPEMIAGGWLLSLLAMLLWGLVGLGLRHLLRLRARPASPELQRVFHEIAGSAGKRVPLLVSQTIHSPITWGALRPVIIVPHSFEDEAIDRERRWGLAHEWSHVKERDFASLWLAVAVQFLCFYQPLYWMLRRRMLLCQDYIADAFAAQQADSPEDYAAFLIRLAKSRLQPATSLALGIVDRRSQLFLRVKVLLDSQATIQRVCTRRFTAMTACVSLICLLLLTTIELDANGQSQQSASAANPPESSSPAGERSSATATATVTATKPSETEEAPAEAGVITGVLVDATGNAVAGARVILWGGKRATTTSDAAGQFRFENVEGKPLYFQLLAYQQNLITEKVRLTASPGDGAGTVRFRPVRLTMRPGRQVQLRITSQETGKPIPGAVVSISYPDLRKMPTGDDGTATLEGLLAERYNVTVLAEGYARSTPQIDLTRQGDTVTEYAVAMLPGGEVNGVVIDEQGQPVADAAIGYRVTSSNGFQGDQPRTDSEGRFRSRYLPLNEPLELSLSKPDYLRVQQDASLTTTLRTRELRITMQRRPPGGSVKGVVRDRNGNPVAGAQVANHGNESSQERLTTTDAEGGFVLDDLYEGFAGVDLLVSAKGFAPQLVNVKPGTQQAPAETSVTLQPGSTVRGRVVNERGEPIGGVFVTARSNAYRHRMAAFEVDEQGNFAFDSLPADVQFQFTHPKYISSDNLALPLDGSEPVTVKLPDPGLLQGRVIDAVTKQPIRQFRIKLHFSRVRQPGDARGSYNGMWSDPGLTFQADDGRFEIQPLMVGLPLEIIVEAKGYERQSVPRAVAGSIHDATDLAIRLTPKTVMAPYALTVRLRDDAGKPLSNAELRLIVSKNQPTGRDDSAFNWALIDSSNLAEKSYVEQFLPGVTDAEGKCEFKDIVPGRYVQLAYWGAGVPKGRSLAFDETRSGQSDSVEIDVPKPATVRGSLDRSQFLAIDAVRLYGPEPFLDFQTKLADGQSTFELRDLPPGEYWISVVGKPERFIENGAEMFRISPVASQRLKLKPGDVQEVRFDKPDPKRR